MKTKLLWGVLLLALAAALAAYFMRTQCPIPTIGALQIAGEGTPLRSSRPAELPIYGRVPEADLTDQTGRPFTLASLKGRAWIADFIFTSCAGTCPQMTARMAALQGKLPPELHLVSISVDPERDTPAVLAEYAGRHGADPARWHFLTGEPTQIPKLVSEGFRLSYAEGTDPAEPIIHSVRFVLVDPSGAIRGYYDSTDPAHLDRLISDAESLLRDSFE